MIYPFIKKILFTLDPEVAHELTLQMMKNFSFAAKGLGIKKNNIYQVKVGAMTWDFPIGLAAGLDKNAIAISFLQNLGFGAIEVGTVTPKPQAGNNKPRLFRLKEQKSLRNRMGFNNEGMNVVFKNLTTTHKRGVVGVNLGKNKDTNNDKASDDYLKLYEVFAPVSDYLIINLSSPNTPGLRDLLAASGLTQIFEKLKAAREKYPCPLYLKISPDITKDQLELIIKSCEEFALSGIVATNTTIRADLGEGGISGELLKEKAQVIRSLTLDLSRKIPLFQVIGVGAVSEYEDLVTFWRQGGSVMQVYTSFIYQGPEILQKIKVGIDRDLEKLNLVQNYPQNKIKN